MLDYLGLKLYGKKERESFGHCTKYSILTAHRTPGQYPGHTPGQTEGQAPGPGHRCSVFSFDWSNHLSI
jgi:hypothetical protein